MLSVIIPLYNKEKTIRRTVDSILTQPYKDIEVIVIDDGSTDKSLSQIDKINDKRLRIVQQVNGGVSSARNQGIKLAKGEWIYFIDADDFISCDKGFSIFEPGIIAEADIVVANFNCITKSGTKPYCINQPTLGFIKQPYKFHYLRKCFFQAGSFIVKREIAIRNPFDENLRRYEDSDAYFRWVSESRVFWVPELVFSSDRRYSDLAKPNQKNWNADFAFHLNWNYGFWRNLCQATILQEALIAYPSKKDLLIRKYRFTGRFYTYINKCVRKFLTLKSKII